MAEVTPEQQAQIDELARQVGGSLGGKMGAQMTKGVAKTATNEVKTMNAMSGQGQETKFMYGGWAGGAHEAATRYRKQADEAQWRPGVQVNYGAADGTRSSSLGMADLMARRARGETPSIAGMMADRQMGQAAAEQSSAAASARGPAALALAQQGAAGNTAAMQSNISNSAQINGAQERLAAEQAAFGAYSGTSAQDAQRAQAQAGFDAQQRQQNDSMTLGMTGYETGVQSAQMNGGMALVNQQMTGMANYQNLVAQRKAAANAKDGQLLQAGATTAGTAAMFMSDEQTKVPVATWGSGPAPSPATSTWGTGAGINPVDHAAEQAHAALDQQQAREMTPGPGSFGGGFDSVEHGIGALKRRNDEDLALIKSKERVGAKLTKKEGWMRGAMERRARMDAGQPEPGAARAAAAPAREREKPTKGEAIGGGLMQLGRVFGNAPAPGPAPMMQAQLGHVQAPTSMSDDKTKLRAAWDAGHSAAIANVEDRSRQSASEIASADEGGSETAAAVRGIKARTWDEAATEGGKAVARATSSQRNEAINADMDRSREEMHARMAADRPVEDPNAPFYEPQPAVARPAGAQLSQSGDPQTRRSPVSFEREGAGAGPALVSAAGRGAVEGGSRGFSPMAGRMRAMVSDEKTKRPLVTTSASGKADPNVITPGNINHYGRASIDNHDGTTSTVRSMSFNDGKGHEVLIPTAYDGAVHSEDEAIDNYRKTGQHMGVFKTPEAATASAMKVHEDYENGRYLDGPAHVIEQRAPKTTVEERAAALKTTTSDERTKDIEAISAEHSGGKSVGTLGKQVPHSDMAEFARSMRGVPYAYKKGFAQREGQAPGEVNVGPVAQEMEKSKVGATIVKPDPEGSGMRTLDQPKMLKGIGAVVADQQDQIDELHSLMARRLGRRGAR